MSNTPTSFDPDNAAEYFDADYYERGVETGKGLYSNYRWMPRRSYAEALAIIGLMDIGVGGTLLDVGCAKGFLVRAMRELDVEAEGCDISEYAIADNPYLWLATQAAWSARRGRGYDFAVCRDVLEHNSQGDVEILLRQVATITNCCVVVVPLADDGLYRIPAYEGDPSHILRLDEKEWLALFSVSGWHLKYGTYHVPGIKDNWYGVCRDGNAVYVLEKPQ